MMTTQKQIRAAFWETFPNLPRRRYRYSLFQSDKSAPLVHPTATRSAFVYFVDHLARSGEISETLAQRATL